MIEDFKEIQNDPDRSEKINQDLTQRLMEADINQDAIIQYDEYKLFLDNRIKEAATKYDGIYYSYSDD